MFLGPVNVDCLAVGHNFAGDRNILKAEESPVVLLHIFSSAQSEIGLPVESSLSEHRAYEAARFKVVLDLFQDLEFGLGRRANQDDL